MAVDEKLLVIEATKAQIARQIYQMAMACNVHAALFVIKHSKPEAVTITQPRR